MSPVFQCTDPAGLTEGVTQAATALREGQLVVLPTDTLYGIAADAFNAEAVTALLAAKGRGRDMPPPVLVAGPDVVDGLATDVPDYVRAAVADHWPGPLTVILRAQPSLAWDIGDTNGTVALRMPDHPVALDLLAEVGPLAVSSANRSGWPAARSVVDAATQLGASVQVYLDAGPVSSGMASTILDCTGQEPVVVRAGAVAAQDLLSYAQRQPTADTPETPSERTTQP